MQRQFGAMRALAEADSLRLQIEREEKIDLAEVDRFIASEPEDFLSIAFRRTIEEAAELKSRQRLVLRKLRALEHTIVLKAQGIKSKVA